MCIKIHEPRPEFVHSLWMQFVLNYLFSSFFLTAACIFMSAWFVSFRLYIQVFVALIFSITLHRKDNLFQFPFKGSITAFLFLAMKLVISSHISQKSCFFISWHIWLPHALLLLQVMHIFNQHHFFFMFSLTFVCYGCPQWGKEWLATPCVSILLLSPPWGLPVGL